MNSVPLLENWLCLHLIGTKNFSADKLICFYNNAAFYASVSVLTCTDSFIIVFIFSPRYVSRVEELSRSSVWFCPCLKLVCLCLSVEARVLTQIAPGRSLQRSDHLLVPFQSCSLGRTGVNVAPTLTHSKKPALLLFIFYHPLLPFCSLISLPRLASLLLPAPFTPPVVLDVNKSDSGAAEMTEWACLQGHLSPPPPCCDVLCPHHSTSAIFSTPAADVV